MNRTVLKEKSETQRAEERLRQENRQATTSRWGSPQALYWNGKEAVLDCNTGSYRVIGENGGVGTWTKNLIIEEPN